MKKIIFIYPATNQFSGQTKASELILDLFKSNNDYDIIPLLFPAYERNKKNAILKYFSCIMKFHITLFLLLFEKYDILYLSLGQSMNKFLFLGIPVVVFKWIKSLKFICSIHGNDFTQWKKESLRLRMYSFILKQASKVTTLGKRQEIILDQLDINSYIRVPNAVDLPEYSVDILLEKHNSSSPVNILHLSTLLEKKGFTRYIEAIKLLPLNSANSWQSELCGPIMFCDSCTIFHTFQEKENYINQNIKLLDGKLRWIKGLSGIPKFNLLRQAHIFVFPSDFPTESLPLVILEAAASGCAIICSRVGEIPNYFNDNEIFFLDSLDPCEISNKINLLLENKKMRKLFCINGYNKYKEIFSKESYYENWCSIFNL